MEMGTVHTAHGDIKGWQTPFGLLALIPPRWLDKDPEYQRDFDADWAEEIAGGWVNTMCRPVNARLRDERLWVTNGQHTAEAAVIAGVEELLVVINNGSPSRAAEAEEFVNFQTKVKRMRPFDVYRAALVAGKPDALVVRKVATELGLTIAPRLDGDWTNVTSITALRDLAGNGGEDDEQALHDVLKIAIEAWQAEPDMHRFRSDLLYGIDAAIDIRDVPTVLRNAKRYPTSDALYQEANAEARGRGYRTRALIRDRLAVVPRRQQSRRPVIHAAE